MSPKWAILCQMWRKTLLGSVLSIIVGIWKKVILSRTTVTTAICVHCFYAVITLKLCSYHHCKQLFESIKVLSWVTICNFYYVMDFWCICFLVKIQTCQFDGHFPGELAPVKLRPFCYQTENTQSHSFSSLFLLLQTLKGNDATSFHWLFNAGTCC